MGERAVTVLVVDDDPNVRALLAVALRASGFDVHTAGDDAAAMTVAGTHPPDIMVLGAVLPDGFALARKLRDELREQRSAVPALFLTARDSMAERIAGLTAGGDDYVTKPFSVEEVELRLRSILRRTSRDGDANGPDHARLAYADLELDEEAHEVRRAGHVVDLSPTEFSLLRFLIRNAGQVLTKAQILDRVWSYDYTGDSRIVESYISYLRRKVDLTGSPLIHTVRGVGYTLR